MNENLTKYFNLDFFLKYTLAIFLLFMGFDKLISANLIFEFSGEAEVLYNALDRSGFILPFVAVIEILSGSLLIRKNTTPLGLIVLLPVSISVILFHLFLAPFQVLPALIVLSLNLILIYRDRAIYAPIFHSITDGEDEVKESISKVHWETTKY